MDAEQVAAQSRILVSMEPKTLHISHWFDGWRFIRDIATGNLYEVIYDEPLHNQEAMREATEGSNNVTM
jgi:hypothetical protein